MEKDQGRDQNMDKIMKQHDILSKTVMEVGAPSVYFWGVECSSPNESKFEAF